MKQPSQMTRTAILVEGALMVAMSFALSMVPFIQLPWGGDITLLSTLPIIMFSMRHSMGWGISAAAVYSVLQLMQGLPNVVAVPTKTLFAMVLCALLDYLIGYNAIGFSGSIARRFSSRAVGAAVGVGVTGLIRYASSILSGIILWGQWAWEGWPVWQYSMAYNAAWCLPDVALVLIAAVLLVRVPMLGMLQPKIAEKPSTVHP